MGKKERKLASAASAAVAAAGAVEEPEPSMQGEGAHPWWLDEVRRQPSTVDGVNSRLYLVLEGSAAHTDLVELLISAIRSGVRRKFTLLELSAALARVSDHKADISHHKRPSGKVAKREDNKPDKTSGKVTKSNVVSGASPIDAMLDAAGKQLSADGHLSSEMTAMVLKQALLQLLEERNRVVGIGDVMVVPQTAVSAKPMPAKNKPKKKSKKQRQHSMAKGSKSPDELKDQKDKLKEDKAFDSFCETKQISLRRRDEPVEPTYKDDEPTDGPDLYIILVGCRDPGLPRALAICGVRVEAIMKLGGNPCQLTSAPVSANTSKKSSRKNTANQQEIDPAFEFWSNLPANLISCHDAPDLKDTAVIHFSMDRCRLQFATSPSAAAEDLYTEVARELYRYLKLRQIFGKYRQAVASVPVPDAPQPSLERIGGALAPGPVVVGDDIAAASARTLPPPSDPCLGDPAEYRRLLQDLPPESISVALIVNALVEQVCVWQNASPVNQEHSVALSDRDEEMESFADEPDESVELTESPATVLDDEYSGPYSLQAEFAPQTVDLTSDPVLVHEEDTVNAQFFDWNDREVILSTEHILAQSAEVHSLQCRPPAPEISLWRHHSMRQQLIDKEGGLQSLEAADHALRQLMFESMYAALSVTGGVNVKPYPHPFLPEQTVCFDVQHLTAECGGNELSEDATILDSRDVLLESTARFSDFRVWERLDRLTMAQQLHAARETRQLLAAYHFGGDDGLYLAYGQPRVRSGNMQYTWSSRAHTNIGFRDFVDSVQLWPEVSEWLHSQYRELLESAEAPKLQLSSDQVDQFPDKNELIPEKSTETGVQLPDSIFVVPGSIKYEQATGRTAAPQYKKEDNEKDEPKEAESRARPRRLSKKAEKDSGPRKQSRSASKAKAETGDSLQPAHQSLSLAEFEIRPKSPENTDMLDNAFSRVSPAKVFAGYDVQMERLLSVEGHQRRQYFSNGSHVTVNRSDFVHGPTQLSVTVCHEETCLTLHPTNTETGENDVIAILSGGLVMHPRPITCVEQLRSPTPPATPADNSATSSRKVSRLKSSYRSSYVKDDKSDKKGRKAEKRKDARKGRDEKGGKKERSGKKRLESIAVELKASYLEEAAADVAQPTVEEPVPASRRVQTLTLSCPSGLMVELVPDPFWPGPEPHVRVIQYYLDSACHRRDIRIHLPDGTLLCMAEDGSEDDSLITMHSIDGGMRVLKRAGDTLLPVSEISPTGRRIVYAADAPPEPRPLLSKVATDPVTSELYIRREDGMQAVIRPGGQAVLQFADGTRITMAYPRPTSADDAREDPRPGGCSDYIVNEAGWIGSPRMTWLLGARVTIDDGACGEMVVLTEHPRYARVQMDESRRTCTVEMPEGVQLDVTSGGVYQLVQSNGTQIQLDTQVLCFSTPADEELRPVVHTLRLGSPESPAPLSDPLPPFVNGENLPGSAELVTADADELELLLTKSRDNVTGEDKEQPDTEAGVDQQKTDDAADEVKVQQSQSLNSAQTQEIGQVEPVQSMEADNSPKDLQLPVDADTKDGDLRAEVVGETADNTAPGAPSTPPPPPPPKDILCETVDSDGAVWHVTSSGDLIPAEGEVVNEFADSARLESREQVEAETVLPELPLLFVLYREGDGIRMLTVDEAETYLGEVDATPGSLILHRPHMSDKDIVVWTTFRPVLRPLSERWRMAYIESDLVPPNLRCRDPRILRPECEPPIGGSTVWGKGDVMQSDKPPSLSLPSGLVKTRELLVAPRLSGDLHRVIIQTVHGARVRYRAGLDSKVLKGEPPHPWRIEQIYEPDRLMETLVTTSKHRVSSLGSEPARERGYSRQLSIASNAVSELDKIIIYRSMLKKNRFPAFFLTREGREFLATVRQSESGKELTAPTKRRRCDTPPHVRPVTPGDASEFTDIFPEPLDVRCVPMRLNMGLTRRDESVTKQLHLYNTCEREAAYRVVSEVSAVGICVQPQCGVISPLSEQVLHVKFQPSCRLRSRTLYTKLVLMVEEVGILYVPVVACVGGGACGDILLEDSLEAEVSYKSVY